MAKALSIRQPWAWAILYSGKDVENRTWRTKHRGLVVVHAGKTVDRDALAALAGLNLPTTFNTGCLLGTVRLVGCVRDAFSGWAEPGAWHWQLADPRLFSEPIPWAGRQGLFIVPDGVLSARRIETLTTSGGLL